MGKSSKKSSTKERVAAAPETMTEISDSFSVSESEEAVLLSQPQKKVDIKAAGSDDSSSDESDEDEPQRKKIKAQVFTQSTVTTNAGKLNTKDTQKLSTSYDESSDDERTKSQLLRKTTHQPTHVSKKGSESDMDYEEPQNPSTPPVQTGGSKILFVGNLEFTADQDDLKNFFKDIGVIIKVSIGYDREGASRGYCYVEFATEGAAQKALTLDGRDLMDKHVRLHLVEASAASLPQGTKGRILVSGFHKKCGEHMVRSALVEHFASCGEISCVQVKKAKGTSVISFKDSDSVCKALDLGRTKLDGWTLSVTQAKSGDDNRTGSGRGARQSDGGRFGGRGGRSVDGRFGGCGRGRGAPSKPSMGTG